LTKRKELVLRIDPALHDELRRWADSELRSLNAQIEYLLRRAVEQRRRAGEGESADRKEGPRS
jgi:hypothetical protein